MRILLIGQDNFFENNASVQADFLPTRKRSLIPNPADNKFGWRDCVRVAMNLVARRYTHCIVPAIYYDWQYTDGLKRAMRKVLRNKLVIRAVRLLLNRTKVVVLDYYDYTRLALDFARDYGASLYFKVNLSSEQKSGDGDPLFYYLPFWINNPNTSPEALNDSEKKDVDVFFASTINSESRRAAPQILALLKKRGFNVVHPEKRLSYQDFVSMLLRAKVILSPEGLGWHNFRHYEALACGAVPAINRAEEPILTDLAGGVNCIIYDSHENAVDQISKYLKGEMTLPFSPRELAAFAKQRHTIEALGNYLLRMLAEDGNAALEHQNALTPALPAVVRP